MKYRQVVGIGELLGGYGGDIICIDVEKEGGQADDDENWLMKPAYKGKFLLTPFMNQ